VRVERHQSPKSLHEQDEPGLAIRVGLPVSLGEQAPDDAAQLTQAMALVSSGTRMCRVRTEGRKAGAQDRGDGERVLAVRHPDQDLLLDPRAVDQHPLLMRTVLGAHTACA